MCTCSCTYSNGREVMFQQVQLYRYFTYFKCTGRIRTVPQCTGDVSGSCSFGKVRQVPANSVDRNRGQARILHYVLLIGVSGLKLCGTIRNLKFQHSFSGVLSVLKRCFSCNDFTLNSVRKKILQHGLDKAYVFNKIRTFLIILSQK